jgi:hypothetical protein
MDSPEEIEKLSVERIEEAQILFGSKKFDGAYYLSGYSIELALKAKICRLLKIPNLFTSDEKKLQDIGGIVEVRKALKTHNLFTLLIFSGLKEKFEIDKATIKSLSLGSSIFFQNWSANLRYRPCGSVEEAECMELLELLTCEEGILKWIANN